MAKLLCFSLPSLAIMLHRNMNLVQALSIATSQIFPQQEQGGLACRPGWLSGSSRGLRGAPPSPRGSSSSMIPKLEASSLILLG
jgi:hypothetical protein